jgi:hypothetical protein
MYGFRPFSRACTEAITEDKCSPRFEQLAAAGMARTPRWPAIYVGASCCSLLSLFAASSS